MLALEYFKQRSLARRRLANDSPKLVELGESREGEGQIREYWGIRCGIFTWPAVVPVEGPILDPYQR